MTTIAKLSLGMMGMLRPRPVVNVAASSIGLLPPINDGGLPVLEALAKRRSEREVRA